MRKRRAFTWSSISPRAARRSAPNLDDGDAAAERLKVLSRHRSRQTFCARRFFAPYPWRCAAIPRQRESVSAPCSGPTGVLIDSMIASSERTAPGFATTTAVTPSPKSGCGTPNTALSRTPSMASNSRFHFLGIDVVAAADHQVFGAADDVHVAIAVDASHIAGLKPSIRGKLAARLLLVAPIPREHIGAFDLKSADDIRIEFDRAVFRVPHAQRNSFQGRTDRAGQSQRRR